MYYDIFKGGVMKDLEYYVGQELTPEVEKELEDLGVLVHKPGFAFTCDFNPFRVNAEIENNIITGFYNG
jgi:hypothetical protein